MGQAAPLYLEVIMLAIIRTIIVIIYTILVCVLGGIYCLFSPRNPKHVMTFGHLFGRLSGVFGIKLIKRIPQQAKIILRVFILVITKIIMIWSLSLMGFSRVQ